jgi:hypothetical protein
LVQKSHQDVVLPAISSQQLDGKPEHCNRGRDRTIESNVLYTKSTIRGSKIESSR